MVLVDQFSIAPELEECVLWGNGCWRNATLPAIYIHCEESYVQLGFFGGSRLDDRQQVLRGNGKYVRHIKIESESDIDQTLFTPIIKQASTYNYKQH